MDQDHRHLDAVAARHKSVIEHGVFGLPGITAQPPGPPRTALDFTFGCLGIPFAGRLERAAGHARFSFDGLLGPMPYSIEAPRTRRMVRDVLTAARTCPAARFVVDAEHQLRLVGDVTLGLPVRPADIVAETALGLAAMKPHLDRLSALLPAHERERAGQPPSPSSRS
jgi:hypothetical protein